MRYLLLAMTLVLAACERENRRFREVAGASTATPPVTMTDLQAGGRTVAMVADHPYLHNAWAIAEGKRLFNWMNCAGCHSPNGGGGMGPPLSDDQWIYGNEPENIFATITQGRPNGMPSFGGRLGNQQVWQLVAYVRTLSGLQRFDVRTSRSDQITGRESEIRRDAPERGPPSTTPPPSERP